MQAIFFDRVYQEIVMKHAVLVALGFAALALSISVAFADDEPLKNSDQIKRFWEKHQPENGNGGG